jgi:uncharacterized SAM-binding protein YcdF (DUF218 family)
MSQPSTAPRHIVIVLGSTNTRNGRLSPMGVRRLTCALALYRTRPADTQLLLTGGFGAHFNTTAQPHWSYARAWLRRHGVPEAAFLGFVASTNTPDDARLAADLLARHPAARVTLVTSDFHVARARYLFGRHLRERRFRTAGSPCLAHFTADRQLRLVAHERQRLREYREADRHPRP